MRFLIVVPRMVNRIGDFYQFPQGIAYISAMMSKEGFTTYKLNLNHINRPVYEAIEDVIKKNDIDVIMTGGLTGQYGGIRKVIESAKSVKSDIITIVGGGIITSAPLYAMKALEYSDFGVIGEGEYTICRLSHALQNGYSFEDIPGIIYKQDKDGFVITEGKPETVDLDNIPFPDYEGLCLDELLKTIPNIIGMSEYNTFPIITSRGCPYRCTFCFHPSGQKYRRRSLDNVFDEIDLLIQMYNIRYLSIQDELFGHDIAWVNRFCERIKPYGLKWFAQFRVTDITQELIKILKEANCSSIGFGIESADNRILKSMKKGITLQDTERALDIVHKAGIGIQGCLIFGDIAETIETAKNTINWWRNHKHYGLQLHVVGTYPGTELFEYALKNGLIKDPVQFIKDSCPTVKLSKMTTDEYGWVLEQILDSQRSKDCIPEDIRSTYLDENTGYLNIIGLCPSCLSENKWENIRLFIADSIVCKNCGRRLYAPIPEIIIDRITKNTEELLRKFKKIAFWGINSYFYEVCKRLQHKLQVCSDIYCVDKSEIRHGIKIFNTTVKPTDIINEENIPCVVVAVPQYFANLKPMIEDEFSNTVVYSITQLFSSSDSCDLNSII